MKWVLRSLIFLGAAGVCFWLWTVFFPSPEKVIRKKIADIQQIASFDSREAPLARMANASKFAGFFTPDIQIIVDLPGQQGMLEGRDELFQRAVAARNNLQGLEVKLYDANVKVLPGKQTALVNLTATAKIPGEKDFMVQEMDVSMVNAGGKWLVKQVKTVRTLK